MNSQKILIIDDEKAICDACSQIFTDDGYLVETSLEETKGLKRIDDFEPDIVFVDLRMPKMTGIEVLEKIKEKDKNIVSVIITGYGTIELAVESIKKGAFDFLPKPITVEKLKDVARKALEKRKTLLEADRLRKEKTVTKHDQYIFTADLAAFVKPLDLPPSLYPFAKCTDWADNNQKEADVRFLIFKIRGTVDSYHAIIVRKGTHMEQIKKKIREDLGTVKLSNETIEKIKELLRKFERGEFTYFVSHRVMTKEYPHKH